MIDTLKTAIDHSLCVLFVYDGKERIIEVHALGHEHVRGYQVGGESSRPLPAWALYRLDRIEADGMKLLSLESQAPRPGYKMGDKQLGEIVAQIQMEEVAA